MGGNLRAEDVVLLDHFDVGAGDRVWQCVLVVQSGAICRTRCIASKR